MKIKKCYGSCVNANPCSEVIMGVISEVYVDQPMNRDHMIERHIASNHSRISSPNFWMVDVCAETNNQR